MQLMKMSTSRISKKGPPFAVSAKSHLRMFDLEVHIHDMDYGYIHTRTLLFQP